MTTPKRKTHESDAPLKRTRDQADTDPLPYTQVDRAVKQTAAVIASRLGVSFQHAVGGLVQFWEMNGDPRDLEALLLAGKREVVLSRDEVSRRFALAMAADPSKLDPDDLTALRLLERKDDGSFRVRGMSRYLVPIRERLQFRAAAIAGGKARALAERGPDGRYLARAPAGSPAGHPAGASAGPSAGGRQGTRRATTGDLDQQEPSTAVSGQRSAVSGAEKIPSPRPKRASKPPASKISDPRFGPLIGRLKGIYERVSGQAYVFSKADGAALAALIAIANDDEIERRWNLGLSADKFSTKCGTVLQLRGRWNELAVARQAAPRRELDLNDGIMRAGGVETGLPQWDRNSPAGERWGDLLQDLRRAGAAYAVSQLERLVPELAGRQLKLRAQDEQFAAWCTENYGPLLEKHAGGPIEILPPTTERASA